MLLLSILATEPGYFTVLISSLEKFDHINFLNQGMITFVFFCTSPVCLSSAVNGADVCASASSEVEEEDVSYCCEDDSLYVMFKSEDNTCRCRTKEEVSCPFCVQR